MEYLKHAPTWVWASIVGLVTVLSLITGMITIWNQIEIHTNDAIQTAATLITTEIRNQTSTIAEFYEDDLYERIIILETDVDQMKANNITVPVQSIIHLKSMRERLAEFKGRE